MRKVLSILLAVVMLAVCSVISYDAADKPRFQAEIVRGNVGETVDVKLNIQNNPGITALSIDVSYSSDDLELIHWLYCVFVFEITPFALGSISATIQKMYLTTLCRINRLR